MNWKEIKKSIKKQLLSRNLSNPNIRLNALENIENLLEKRLVDNPNQILSVDKQDLKDSLSKKKKWLTLILWGLSKKFV